MSTPLKIVIYAVSSIALLFLICLLVIYFALFRPNILRIEPRYVSENSENKVPNSVERILAGYEYYKTEKSEDVSIKSFDGLTLKAKFFASKDGEKNAKGTMILMHGFHSSGQNDFGYMLSFYRNLGYNILVPWQRSHGESEGKYITFGVKERFDCKNWIDFVNSRLGDEKNIYLHGISMGCATVVMTSGFDLPKNVKGIIADCGFTRAYEEMAHVIATDYKLPAKPVLFFANILTKIISDWDLKEYSTFDALKTNKIPVLFIHGGKDDFVPTYMTHENFNTCTAEKELLIIEEAEHAMSYLVDTEQVQTRIMQFIEKHK